MADAAKPKYWAAIGLNLPPDDARFEAGDPVPHGKVEPWMVAEGLVTTDDPAQPAKATKETPAPSSAKTTPAASTGAEA